MPIRGEVDFMRKLMDELTLKADFRLTREPNAGEGDLLILDQTSGKRLIVEIKNAGDYGELPISTIIPIAKLANQKDKFDKVLLISFSDVPVLLSKKLQELNVEALTKPTVNQAVEKIQLALSA